MAEKSYLTQYIFLNSGRILAIPPQTYSSTWGSMFRKCLSLAYLDSCKRDTPNYNTTVKLKDWIPGKWISRDSRKVMLRIQNIWFYSDQISSFTFWKPFFNFISFIELWSRLQCGIIHSYQINNIPKKHLSSLYYVEEYLFISQRETKKNIDQKTVLVLTEILHFLNIFVITKL